MAEKILASGGDATSLIKELLETWPLYRSIQFRIAVPTLGLSFPTELNLYCNKCTKHQQWKQGGRQELGSIYVHLTYLCKNCEESSSNYFLQRIYYSNGSWLVQKVGQVPAQEIEPPPALAKRLSPDDLAFYRKALTCRQFSYGVAALSYLRRVVENQMNSILDLIAAAAHEAGFAPEELKELEETKKSRRFDDKVTYAAEITPPSLRPGGVNPIDRLHDLTSEGIHALPEEESLSRFDRCRVAFEHFFTRLHFEKQQALEYVAAMRALESPKPKA